jgi:hypothetical protein
MPTSSRADIVGHITRQRFGSPHSTPTDEEPFLKKLVG